jgi:hypothetical protein
MRNSPSRFIAIKCQADPSFQAKQISVIVLMTAPDRSARNPRLAGREPLLGRSGNRSRTDTLHYLGTLSVSPRDADRSRKQSSSPAKFDFSIPEARLLLFPLFAQAPEFGDSSHLRVARLRILADWGLTNGMNGVMIDCMHGVNQSLAWLSGGFADLRSRTGTGAREAMVDKSKAGGSWTLRGEDPTFELA